MLLTNKINIKITSGFYVKYFKDNGFNIKMNDEIEIDISLLPKGSHEKVTASCDYCGDIRELCYKEYNYSIKSNNKFCCKNCITKKISEAFIKKYNKKNYVETDEFKEKSAKACLEKYNVDRYCKTKECVKKSKKTSIERYGVDHYSKTEEYSKRCKETSLKNYGVENPMQNKDNVNKAQSTLIEKTGYKHALQNPKSLEKKKNTCLDKYGFDNYTKTVKYKDEYSKNYKLRTYDEIEKKKEKFKNTCIEKYGVESPMQDKDIHEKQQISAYKLKNYKNLFYRGSYELDFLENFYGKIKVEKSNSIPYLYKNKNKRYHPDFFIKDYNLIVEIKSLYTYNYDIDKNEAKRKASLERGYDFIFIIDKDYREFINKIDLI